MNLEPHALDSLRKLVRDLQKENKQLPILLEESNIPYGKSEVFSELVTNSPEHDPDQGARILPKYVDEYLATKFF